MDSYFGDNGADDFGSFVSDGSTPGVEVPAIGESAAAQILPHSNSQPQMNHPMPSNDAASTNANGDPTATSSFDYFGASAASVDDPFAFPSSGNDENSAVNESNVIAETANATTANAELVEEPIAEVDLNANPVQEPVAQATTEPAPSVASYFGASDSNSGFEEITTAQTAEASAQSMASDSASSVSSYFGSTGGDDPFGSGSISDPDPASSSTVEPSSSGIGYFDSVPADDWMNAGAMQGIPSQQQQAFASFPPAHDPYAAHPSQQSFPPKPTAVSAPAPSFPQAPPAHSLAAPQPSAHAQAPGGPVVSSNSNTPSLPSTATATSGAVDDYFGAHPGSEDWLSQPAVEAAPAPVAQPPAHHPPASLFPSKPAQAYHSGYLANPYAEHSRGAPSLSVPPSRQISDLGDVDLDSPARPVLGHSTSAAEMAEIPLSGPTPTTNPPPATLPTQQQQPAMPSGYDRGGYGGYGRGAEERDPYAAAARPPAAVASQPPAMTNPYQPQAAPPPQQPAYGSAPAMPPPSSESGRALPPSAFMPRPAAPQAGVWQPPVPNPQPGMQAQHTQPTPYGQPGLMGAPAMQQTAGGQQQPYRSADPSTAQNPLAQPQHLQQSNLYAPPTNLFSPTAQRPWCPPPAVPLVHFGFGGRLVTMLPRFSGVQAQPGAVTMTPLSSLLENQGFVQKLAAFPGPLSNATNPARHPRHVELEDIVQAGADKALYSSLPPDSALQDFVAKSQEHKEHILTNWRQAKRLLHLFLLECLRRNGRIHRASNQWSVNTLPAAPSVEKGGNVEENMIAYLVHLNALDQAHPRKDQQWLDNTGIGGGEVVPNPVKANAPSDPANLLEERQQHDAVTQQLQVLLLKGQRKEACLLAMEKKLWSHALLLASFDMATYHTVVGRFALEQFADGSPVQSLYLLFAQQPNLLFRGVAGPDGKGMDGTVIPGPHFPVFNAANTPPLLRHWKSSLSMFLANPTPNDKQVLTTLGDTLWQNYHLPAAAHLIYLLAGHGLGPEIPGGPQSALPLGRVLLVGADHRKHMRTFATPGAIQRTEILEYTRQLAAMTMAQQQQPQGQAQQQQQGVPFVGLSPAFTLFKLIYAYQLAEIGLNQRALQYCEQLTAIVQNHSKAGKGTLVFPVAFLQGLEALEHRLREALNKAAGPGIGKKLVNKLFNWMVGDSSQAPGTTTVVPPNPVDTAPPPSNLPRSVSSSSIPASKPPVAGNLPNSASSMALSGAGVIPESSTLPPQPPTHSRSATEPQAGSTGGKDKEKDSTPAVGATAKSTIEQEGGEVKPGLFGSIVGSLWGGKKGKKVHRAHIREESSFTFDETLQRWVQRDANGNIVEEEEEKPPPPPSISEEMKEKLRGMSAGGPSNSVSPPLPGASPSSAGGGPALPGMPPPGSMFASRGAGTKNRYALADNSYEDASAAPAALPTLPTPGLPPNVFPPAPGVPSATMAGPVPPTQFKVFRPAVTAPPPGEQYGAAPTAGANGPSAMGQEQQLPAAGNGFHTAAGAMPNQSMPHPQQPQFNAYGAPPPMHSQQQPPPAMLQYGAAPGTHQGYPSQAGYPTPYGAPADLRAQSTPPMRPGTMPPYGSVPFNSLAGAPVTGRLGMPPAPTGPPYGAAPYMPQRPPAY